METVNASYERADGRFGSITGFTAESLAGFIARLEAEGGRVTAVSDQNILANARRIKAAPPQDEVLPLPVMNFGPQSVEHTSPMVGFNLPDAQQPAPSQSFFGAAGGSQEGDSGAGGDALTMPAMEFNQREPRPARNRSKSERKPTENQPAATEDVLPLPAMTF